ncbi:MAG: hypothetical protein WA139_02040 [Candidatus Aenigmatarchaeota archaeon]
MGNSDLPPPSGGVADAVTEKSIDVGVNKIADIGIKKLIELFFTRKYGFTSSKKHAKELYDISNTSLFQEFKNCVASNEYITLVREGLRISALNNEGRRPEIELIKGEVYRKYGSRGIKVLSIASTGEVKKVVEYLIDLKLRKNFNLIDLRNEFEKIVDNWEKITLFVKTDHDKDHIIKEIIWHIEQKQDLFFIFAYGSAIQHTIEIIAKLRNDGIYQGKYLIDGRIDMDGAGKEKYRCIFETIKL